MRGFGRVVRVFNSRKILRLTRELKKILHTNKHLLNQSKNTLDEKLIYCGINNINIITNGLGTKKSIYSPNSLNVLSFYLSISGIVYHIKARIKLNEKPCESKTFYTPSKSSLILLSALSDKSVQKIVYENGIDVIFNFFKYFGVDLQNVYDIKHLLLLYSAIEEQHSTHDYSQLIRANLHQNKGTQTLNSDDSNDSLKGLKDDFIHIGDPNGVEEDLRVIQKIPSILVPFGRIHDLRAYLGSKYGITNETFTLRMETSYGEIKSNPRIYSPVYENLNSGTLNPKILKEKLLSSLLNGNIQLRLLTKSADFSGIILYHFEGNIILNINSFYVNEGVIFPLYGLVTEDNIKYFSDKKIGDTVHCSHIDLENLSVKFTNERACIELKRYNQESLVYSLKSKKYVQFNQIHF
ncbi:hypothetical protein TpMuguga_03g00652 [Theileria parva strain Muguga]|uniref:Uncharacterized protein n=1 Tax=Theileria parva TaxID=5875 RepID=Q4MZ39_THEPA|nr:uncharacterized protein TpMuguga_03g00652 [Theileria parva strain Muguga]EAN30493.1 hypothetical protein TpMuguga_03g00652 [Theileria parva strain Muguga]|eukprot:XP_762776.1 hypothetical protein [Theileria parva strain Muguga]